MDSQILANTVLCFYRYLDRIIRSSELADFSGLLQPHQKAVTSDGEE